MNDVRFWECPNCGGSDFVEVSSHKHRCAYCGTVLTLHEPKAEPGLVTCPRCGFANERGDRYCNNCGRMLGWAPITGSRIDPAVISMAVSIVGSSFLPLGAAILGLILGYRALASARAGGEGSEKLAKAAVIIGWVVMAYSALPLCFIVGGAGAQIASDICDGLIDILSQLGAIGSGG